MLDFRNIDFSQDLFISSPEEYKRDLNPIGQYIEQQAQYLHIMESIPLEEALEFVKDNIKPGGLFPIQNPNVQYVRQDENGDRVEDTTTLGQYLNGTIQDDDVLSATFTTFVNQDKKVSYISEYVDEQFPKRKRLKKRQFECKQIGDIIGMAFANNGQNNVKRSINSISGASSITSTPIYLPSMHPVLTSTCRMTSGYANANNEKLLGGNRHYHSASVTLNNLVALTTRLDEQKIEFTLNQFNLYVPTAEELYQDVFTCTSMYWRWPEKEQEILNFLSKCNRIQRAAIAFIYDLWLMRKYNPEFTRDFIVKLSKDCDPIPSMSKEEAQKVFKQAKESIANIAVQINFDLVKGMKSSDYIESDIVLRLAACIVNIYSTFEEYKDYITTFLKSNHLPSSLARLPHALRKVVLMSDTDSSMFTAEEWTSWIVGKDSDRNDPKVQKTKFAVFANIIGLSDATLKHLLATMSANLGVRKNKIFEIAMKNEFAFPTMVNLNRTKHYIATISYQEGNVYNELDIEKKGVHLKNSNSPQEIIEHAEEIMAKLFYLHSKENIKLIEILKEVGDVEKKIFEMVEAGNADYYRAKQIKDAEAYKKGEEESPYQHYTFWNETFGEYYGMTSAPPYSSFDVKLSINNKTQMNEWLDSFENQDLAERIRNHLDKKGKSIKSTINIPYELFISKPIPKEIIPYVAKRELVANICAPYYIAFEAVGMFFLNKNVTFLISDLYHN